MFTCVYYPRVTFNTSGRRALATAGLLIAALSLPFSTAATATATTNHIVGHAAPAKAKPKAKCVIKGNISNRGEKIYHVPGQRSYKATKIDLKRGERWFCTEKDARKAGWRKAKV